MEMETYGRSVASARTTNMRLFGRVEGVNQDIFEEESDDLKERKGRRSEETRLWRLAGGCI